jgi:hypothetical protein
MKKKGQKSRLLFLLAVASLLTCGAIVTIGFWRNNPKNNQPKESTSPSVLGETAADITSKTATDVNNLVQNSIQNTKETLSQKATETQKTILQTLEKEISTLTQSQVEALKLQICRDWGVITVSPTVNP